MDNNLRPTLRTETSKESRWSNMRSVVATIEAKLRRAPMVKCVEGVLWTVCVPCSVRSNEMPLAERDIRFEALIDREGEAKWNSVPSKIDRVSPVHWMFSIVDRRSSPSYRKRHPRTRDLPSPSSTDRQAIDRRDANRVDSLPVERSTTDHRADFAILRDWSLLRWSTRVWFG